MRFKIPEKPNENNYLERRIIRKFLWFPLQLQNEIRWLEYALIEEEVDYDINIRATSNDKIKVYYWKKVKWINE